jgi:hypothetical protein
MEVFLMMLEPSWEEREAVNRSLWTSPRGEKYSGESPK